MKEKENKTMKRKLFVLSLALILALSLSSNAFAASTITKSDAKSKALKNAGLSKSQVYGLEVDYDDGVYEVEFVKESNGAEYSYEYSKSGKLLEKSVDYNRAPVFGQKKLTKAQARSKVASFGGFKSSTVANGTCYLDSDDGQAIYEISFNTSSYHYEYDVHARTGKVLEYSKERLNR